jgi:hypothetical protein
MKAENREPVAVPAESENSLPVLSENEGGKNSIPGNGIPGNDIPGEAERSGSDLNTEGEKASPSD